MSDEIPGLDSILAAYTTEKHDMRIYKLSNITIIEFCTTDFAEEVGASQVSEAVWIEALDTMTARIKDDSK